LDDSIGKSFESLGIFVVSIGEEIIDAYDVFLEGDVFLKTAGKLFGGANGALMVC